MLDIWLIHGLGDSPRVWRGVRGTLARTNRRIIAPALPGHARTPPLTGRRQDLRGLAHWLEEQIRHRSHDRNVILVGHSMGGMVVTLVASRMPALRGVINIEGPLTLADCDTSRQAAEARDFPRWFRAFKRMVRAPGAAPSHYVASIDEADALSFRSCAQSIVALARRSGMAKLYAGLDVPRIFFYGAAPGGMSKRSIAFLKLHGCSTEEFVAAAHWPMTETPREFVEALVDGVERFI